MKIQILFLFIFFLAISIAEGQEKIYYNQTEFGVLAGRGVDNWMGESDTRIDFSIITFHGVRFGKKNNHVGGISVGFDQYETISIMPVAFGYRALLGKENKALLIGGLDLGGGMTFLEKTEKNEWGANWYEGGMMVSPSIGGYFPGKAGKTALTISLAYKRQGLSLFSGVYDPNTASRPRPSAFSASSLPDGFSSLTETEYLFNSLVIRMGLSF
ncbi:hypothetical protein GCM10009119_26240 [Algoriphagus jejuensis]|uniref:Outer membrane protein with beta-barrel domain n=1 Tax=Algoriphagus jejuensis TaxID=419934 RepID=A0ABP3YE18_9BACT